MSDSASNGWNFNALGIQQNGVIVSTFGKNFTSGGSSGPVSITVQGDVSTQIVFASLSVNTNEMGFVVKAPNGTIIHQRTSGAIAYPGTIFANFCPVGGCLDSNSFITLTITMSDSFGDGWNSAVLGIQQNNVIAGYFGKDFTAGSSSGPVSIILQGNTAAQIVVLTLGTKTN